MTKLYLKYVQSFGGYHYFRRRGLPRIPLPGIVGSAEFMATYQAALSTAPVAIGADKRSKPGSVSAALAEYYGSRSSFRNLGSGTQVLRRAILERFREQHGHLPLASLPKEFIVALLDTMAPHAARNWLKSFRHFFSWCVERKLMGADPTLGVRVKLPKSDGFHTWTEDDVATFEAAHAIGTKARLAMALALYTAQRRSDIIRMGRQHIRDGVLHVRQNKTGAVLNIPVHAELQRIIDATPCGHLTFWVTKTNKPYRGEDLSVMFRRWCDEAKLPAACSIHGLRKAACRRLAEAGCSASEIAAFSGHATLSEVARYTKAADQARLARNAMERIANKTVKPDPDEVSKPLTPLAKTAGQ